MHIESKLCDLRSFDRCGTNRFRHDLCKCAPAHALYCTALYCALQYCTPTRSSTHSSLFHFDSSQLALTLRTKDLSIPCRVESYLFIVLTRKRRERKNVLGVFQLHFEWRGIIPSLFHNYTSTLYPRIPHRPRCHQLRQHQL